MFQLENILFLVICFNSNFISYIRSAGLEDDLQFSIDWPGAISNEDLLKTNLNEILEIKTFDKENYKCVIPPELKEIDNEKKIQNNEYEHVSTLVEPIYSKKICSYRIESYWIYELCHGQHVRQYHETKQSGKRIVPEEYYLGYYDAKKQDLEYHLENGIKKTNIHTKIIEGKKIPLYAVKYTDGTPCLILDNKNREITVFYSCDESGNENIISFEEISSCTYEMIVSSKWLCSHSAFQIPKPVKQVISCYSDQYSHRKPFELIDIEMEKDLAKESDNKMTMTDQDGGLFIIKYRKHNDDIKDEIIDSNTKLNINNNPTFTGNIGSQADNDVIESFLAGSHCLSGGVGWWRHEICYGKHVIQFHEADANSPRVVINLGKWIESEHINWLQQNPHKKPSKLENRNHVSLLYSSGEFCENVNKPRRVEVKLKCDKSKEKEKPHSVTLYLLEPLTCEYSLTIESPLLCPIIQNTDENGLYKKVDIVD